MYRTANLLKKLGIQKLLQLLSTDLLLTFYLHYKMTEHIIHVSH